MQKIPNMIMSFAMVDLEMIEAYDIYSILSNLLTETEHENLKDCVSQQKTQCKTRKKRTFNEIVDVEKTDFVESDSKINPRKKVKYTMQTGFNDGDFHIFDESDEVWMIENDRISKNEMMTELVLGEKEVMMVDAVIGLM